MNVRCLILLFLVPLNLLAQVGEISGTITDEATGGPLSGVNILVKNTFMGTVSDNSGIFRIADLDPGNYTLVISMIGYRKETFTDLQVPPGGTIELKVMLKQDVLSSPQVIVTASRREQDIMEVPLSVAVIGPREIREKAAIDLTEVLLYQAGVNIVKGQLNIRGASGYTLGAGDRSLLLLDGVPLLGSAAGNITWAIIPTSEIEQVEIIKSGGSALYGSSALGGVVNILTRNAPAKPETRVRLKSGLYSEPKYSPWKWRDNPGFFHILEVTHARPIGPHGAWLRIQTNNSDGYTQLNWKKAYNLTGKVKYNYGQNYTFSLYANFYTDKVGLASQWRNAAHPFEAPMGDADDYAQGTKLNVNGFFNMLYSRDTVIKVRTALYDVWWQNYSLTNNDYSNERKWFGEVQFSTNLGKATQTTAGVVVQHGNIDAQIFGNHSSLSGALYFLAEQRVGKKLTLTAGGRFENYQVDGKVLDQTLAPQIALNWRLREWLSLRTSLSRGFRVPTVAEMFTRSQLNVFTIEPNPDLSAETSQSMEMGTTIMLPGNWFLSNLKVDGAVFSTTFYQLIEPTPDAEGIIHFENITDARISGAEVGISGGLFGNLIFVNTAYTWLDPVEIDDQGNVIDTLSYRFRHTWISTVSVRLWGVLAAAEYRYSSRMERVELFQENALTGEDKRVPIHLWNASLGYVWQGWEALFRVENIFQYYYTELERNMGEERDLSFTLSKVF